MKKIYLLSILFIVVIASFGHGPGEFTSLYNVQLDEAGNKVYLTPFANANKLIVYNLESEYLADIPLK
jgi:acetylglutamate kinase